MHEYGVILLNLGGPDSIKNIEKFLYNLFSDPDIFKFPFSPLTQKFFARLISKLRAKKVIKYYLQIGGRSPILGYTLLQAKSLEKKLSSHLNAKVYIGMRYWHPMIDEAVEGALKDNVNTIILLSLYPQYSTTTIGSSLNEFYRIVKRLNLYDKRTIEIKSYPDNELYIKAMAERIEEAMQNFNDEELKSFAMIFSAHGIPIKFIQNGDPYFDETMRSYNAIVDYLRTKTDKKEIYSNIRTELCFQSKVGPLKWPGPSTVDTVKKLASDGIENMLLVPLSFVSDNIETLYELGIFVREIAIKSGVKKYIVAEALNDSETFIEALKNIVLEAVKNAK